MNLKNSTQEELNLLCHENAGMLADLVRIRDGRLDTADDISSMRKFADKVIKKVVKSDEI